jgi:uncharacterized protein YlzI (FlbEa/FlbD family)
MVKGEKMLLKLTNKNGDHFLINETYILEAEERKDGCINTVLFVANGREYLVEETLDQIHEMTSSF